MGTGRLALLGQFDQTWRDKGVNYRLMSLTFGDWTFGYEESAVYIDRAFDPLYFLSPMPSILTNALLTVGSTPWSTSGNDNSLMGLFARVSRRDPRTPRSSSCSTTST